jgi:hypothetical protein
MMGLIDEANEEQRCFGVDTLTRRHRRGSPVRLPEIRRHLRIFDSLLVGLTAARGRN